MIGLIDSTLREGEQMAGVYFSLNQKLEIVKRLAAIGIDEIELGVAAMSQDMVELISQARNIAPRTRLALWCRARLPDILESAEYYPDVLSISLPVSDLHIHKRLGKDRQWVLRQIPVLVEEARQSGIPFVSLGFEDTTRADLSFLYKVLRTAEMAGADRIRLSDTLGLATPMVMGELVRAVKHRVNMQVGVHTHNDFGIATANAITALDVGADWADVTLLGLGERAGNARLEEVVGYLALRRDCSRYDTKRLSGTCRAIARMAGITISPHHPIVGKRIFTCESGLHLDGLTKDPATYEPFIPEMVLAKRKHVLGKKIGRNAVSAYLQAMGFLMTDDEVAAVTLQIRVQAQRLGRPLSDDEVVDLVKYQQDSASTPFYVSVG